MWPKLYSRWMMLHKYILNLDSWKNTVCYEDWQLCLVISFSTKKLGTLSTKLELTEHCIISRCFTLASKIFHSQYFNRVQISNQLPRETVSPGNTLKITLSISKHMRFDELIVSNFVKKSTVSILLRQISVISILGVRIVYGNFDTYCFLRTSIVSKRM